MKQLNIIPNPQNAKRWKTSIPASRAITDRQTARNGARSDRKRFRPPPAAKRGNLLCRSQTLKQLKQLDICPCVRIEDAPAFEYRAFMLDCARHMTTVENIKKLIDAAALVKMNTMHWHLTDDQGWRVEIDSHPELITVGSRRRSSDFGQYHFAEEYSGYFTKDEIREIVAYADEQLY